VTKAPKDFDSTADYNSFGSVNSIVDDPALDSLSTINMISCLTKQLRGRDVGLNSTFNPNNKPYIAMTDSTPCGESGISKWAVTVTGPGDLGDGTYDVMGTFVSNGEQINVQFTNIVSNSALLKSTVSAASGGGMKIMMVNDFKDTTKTDINFIMGIQ
jgi:hypothetical protein